MPGPSTFTLVKCNMGRAASFPLSLPHYYILVWHLLLVPLAGTLNLGELDPKERFLVTKYLKSTAFWRLYCLRRRSHVDPDRCRLWGGTNLRI